MSRRAWEARQVDIDLIRDWAEQTHAPDQFRWGSAVGHDLSGASVWLISHL